MPAPKPESGLLTTQEAYRYLRIGRTSFYKLVAQYRLKRVDMIGGVRWRKADLDRVIEERTTARPRKRRRRPAG